MPKAFSEREKELIGKRLIEQGTKLFSAYGLRKTNVEEIATAAGISKGAFYLFYETKEALFMAVVEEVEKNVRGQLLAAIDRPGPSPRARLFALLKDAYALFHSIPILQFLTGSDYDLVFRRLPAETLQAHLENDLAFFDELVARCREAGIPIRVPPEQIVGLMYPLVIAMLHEADLGQTAFTGSIDPLLELVAAYCLGEVQLQFQNAAGQAPAAEERSRNEPAD